jgi:hypothetical protein
MNDHREETKRVPARAPKNAKVDSQGSFHSRLTAYAMAAGAAGVGLLAAAPPANAEIVFTHAHTTFTNGQLFLDINHDGVNDFVLSIYTFVPGLKDRRMAARGLTPLNGVLGSNGSSYPPVALRPGYSIGPEGPFFQREAPAANVAATFGTVVTGPFPNAGNRYLGLKFNIDGQVHYGWAEVNVKAGVSAHKPGISATLLGYAYETVAGEPLRAGQTSAKAETATTVPGASLAMLALGAPALNLWRREEREA